MAARNPHVVNLDVPENEDSSVSSLAAGMEGQGQEASWWNNTVTSLGAAVSLGPIFPLSQPDMTTIPGMNQAGPYSSITSTALMGDQSPWRNYGDSTPQYYPTSPFRPMSQPNTMVSGMNQALVGGQAPGGNSSYQATLHSAVSQFGPMSRPDAMDQADLRTRTTNTTLVGVQAPGMNYGCSAPSHSAVSSFGQMSLLDMPSSISQAALVGSQAPGKDYGCSAPSRPAVSSFGISQADLDAIINATFVESQTPGENYGDSILHSPDPPIGGISNLDVMTDGYQVEAQASTMSTAIVEIQHLATSSGLTVGPGTYPWVKRAQAESESRRPLNDVDKLVIKCLRGDESNPLPFGRIVELSGFPKVTIHRVLKKLQGQKLLPMELVISQDGTCDFVLTVRPY
ncbi:MAG: hypothetical protein J3Q66DRAFT_406493 [Benniella sp.]|nr:MAG: hypothetical protein J3Q66DRAFT_406493 [Benniella sp.]